MKTRKRTIGLKELRSFDVWSALSLLLEKTANSDEGISRSYFLKQGYCNTKIATNNEPMKTQRLYDTQNNENKSKE